MIKKGGLTPLIFLFLRQQNKPDSVFDNHLSGTTVTRCLKRLTRKRKRTTSYLVFLFRLAPDGVYLADFLSKTTGGLLHRLFTLTCIKQAVCFLWHFPLGFPKQPLAAILSCGVRTFLALKFKVQLSLLPY